jgi:hypothetical protein
MRSGQQMKLWALLAFTSATVNAADVLQIFARQWSVPAGADWKVEMEEGTPVLRLVTPRGPLPGPRRPIQFALAGLTSYAQLTVEADVKPLGEALMIVFAYRDPAHFDYAHLATNTGVQQPAHNGVFHVYGGERVRISGEQGPAAFPESGRWYRARLVHVAKTGIVNVTVDGRELPSLTAVDLSLGPGQVGLGSFDEAGAFRNVRIASK